MPWGVRRSAGLVAAVAALCFAASAQAAEIAVTTAAPSGPGSLANGVAQSNASPTDDRITFAIPGAGPHTISLADQLKITDSVEIVGPASHQLTVEGGGPGSDFRVLEISGAIDVRLEGLTVFKGNVTSSDPHGAKGGGILVDGAQLTLESVAVNANRAVGDHGGSAAPGKSASGGGIHVVAGKLIVLRSEISVNEAVGGNGGPPPPCDPGIDPACGTYPGGAGGNAAGGGIAVAGGSIDLRESTIAANNANGGSAGDFMTTPGGQASGGGLSIGGNGGSISTTTISANAASAGFGGAALSFGFGGGLDLSADTAITAATVARNTAASAGGFPTGANIQRSGGTLSFANTIVADPGGPAPNCGATKGDTNSAGHNLDDGPADGSCEFDHPSDQTDVDPMLAELGDNGGPTSTHALGVESPAIDRGAANGLATDQRGLGRTHDLPAVANGGGDGTDIGAYEWTDTDGDGVENNADADDDGDGTPDDADVFPLDPGESADADFDGVGDNTDNCPATSNSDQADSDGDGAGDGCDKDERATDTTPPEAGLSGAKHQRLGRFITINVACAEACQAQAAATLIVTEPGKGGKKRSKSAATNIAKKKKKRKSRRRFKLASASAAIPAGGKAKLKLRVAKKARSFTGRALRKGAVAKVKVAVKARDSAGNTTKLKRTVKLKPKKRKKSKKKRKGRR